ncbi:MAG: DUF2178 domain-containing protein [Candidatus Altiarchaeota archaeon]|nr:DUF2178 domain-containing protein [Candidatus Altiarchaeota archaeon]
MGVVIGESIKSGNFLIPLIAIAAGTALICLMKKRVDEVLEDERVYKISEKASALTLRVFMTAIPTIGVVLLATSNAGADYEQAAYTLLFSTCALLMLYLASYKYYGREGKV